MNATVEAAFRCRTRWAIAFAWGLWLAVQSAMAAAQVSSEAKGTVTLMAGQAGAPVGGIPQQVADPGVPAPNSTLHATAFRLVAGYHFAEFVSAEIGISHFGSFNSSTPYATIDTLQAQSSIIAAEADLVGHLPFASRGRVNVALGLAETALHTTLATTLGTTLPGGIPSDENVHRTGATAGVELEFRLTDMSSLLVGYHGYTHVGSGKLAGSASGQVNVILAGVHFEF